MIEASALALMVFGKELSAKDHKRLGEMPDELGDRVRSGCAFIRAGRRYLTEENIGAVNQLFRLHGGLPVVWWRNMPPTTRVDISWKSSNY